jgi:hypothetical protein
MNTHLISVALFLLGLFILAVVFYFATRIAYDDAELTVCAHCEEPIEGTIMHCLADEEICSSCWAQDVSPTNPERNF